VAQKPLSGDTDGRSNRNPSVEKSFSFNQDRATYREQNAGPLTSTNNPLDLALHGNGFFTVLTPNGPKLTRSGHFERSQDGTIVDTSGFPVLDTAGKSIQLAVSDTFITVSSLGTISSQNGKIGQIGIVVPADLNRMRAEGGGLLVSDSPTVPFASPSISQGILEGSNVQPTLETTRMMTDLREFQFVSQFVQAEADRQQTAIDKITQRRG
jgi:flagellar basal-body rod protein FlgF